MIYSKIPFGTGTSRFGDDFPQINSMPGPGSYDCDLKSIKSNPNRAPKFHYTHQIRNNSRFDSPRNSIISQTNTIPEPKERKIMPRKSPMKSSLSVSSKNNILKPNTHEGKSVSVSFKLNLYRVWHKSWQVQSKLWLSQEKNALSVSWSTHYKECWFNEKLYGKFY